MPTAKAKSENPHTRPVVPEEDNTPIDGDNGRVVLAANVAADVVALRQAGHVALAPRVEEQEELQEITQVETPELIRIHSHALAHCLYIRELCICTLVNHWIKAHLLLTNLMNYDDEQKHYFQITK